MEELKEDSYKSKKIFLNEKYKKLPNEKGKGEYIYFLMIGNPADRLFKIGTTNNMTRRMKEHRKSYNKNITVIWFKKVTSKWTTLRTEHENKELWKKFEDWEYHRNDRFILPCYVSSIDIKIRKKYHIDLDCDCYEI